MLLQAKCIICLLAYTKEYIYGHYENLQTFIGYGVFAEETLIEILHSNQEMLENHVALKLKNEIAMFVRLIKKSGDHVFLKYLTKLCVCVTTVAPFEQVIPFVQDFVCQQMLNKKANSKILFETK